MKEILISNSEKRYVQKCLNNCTRVDGRAFSEFRELNIDFGRDWGCCHVSLGDTRVLAQVSCEIQQPKSSRPHEGVLNINIELSPMGAPNFEAGRQSELSVHLNRILEKCIKDSRAVDLESLCIKLNEKVWVFRLDLNVLNHEGNLLDCASVAALCALAHFKRPDVTSDGENIIIHTADQRDPIPTTVHHFPVCVSYATFNEGALSIADPTLLEEAVSEGELVFGVNAFKEICSVHLGGNALTSANLIIDCASKAAARALLVVQKIKDCIEQDATNRKTNKITFFEQFINNALTIDVSKEKLNQILDKWTLKESTKRKKENKLVEQNTAIVPLGEGSAELVNKEADTLEGHFEDSSEGSDLEILETNPSIEKIEIVDSDEGENVIMLYPDGAFKKAQK
ncbi:Rrp45 [Carabus blaptoides fortunei]